MVYSQRECLLYLGWAIKALQRGQNRTAYSHLKHAQWHMKNIWTDTCQCSCGMNVESLEGMEV